MSRPYVILGGFMSVDGKSAPANRKGRTFTPLLNEKLLSRLHKIRADVDAVLVGAKKGDAKEIIARDTHLENAKAVLNVLSGKDRSSRKDLIIVNAAAILYLGDVTNSFKEGYEIASNSIETGEAIKKVEELVKCSRGDLKSFRNLLR